MGIRTFFLVFVFGFYQQILKAEIPQSAVVVDSPAFERPPVNLNFLKKTVDLYQRRYDLKDLSAKLIDNQGNGFNEKLYGVRNFRVVLPGIFYRGGANNSFNKHHKRENRNPLPQEGLVNLCKEGFSEGLYFYTTNFKKVEPIKCNLNSELGGLESQLQNSNEPNILTYQQMSPFSGDKFTFEFLEKIFLRIRGQIKGPLYGHCWNGWHASGFGAAIVLRQFCNYSPDEAYDYWVKNTDGHAAGRNTQNTHQNESLVHSKIVSFSKVSDFAITEPEAKLVCPTSHRSGF